MCLDIKKFYLTAALDYFEYMKMPLMVYPEWIRKQYNLDATGWNPCQQIAAQMAGTPWIF